MYKSIILIILSALATNILLDVPIINEFISIRQSDLFTANELAKHNGIVKSTLYLAILGQVFDVTKGGRYYGPEETYHIFIGRDNSKSFITGKFNENDISDEVIGSSNDDLRSLNHWLKFYKKEYTKIGKLIGRYYNANGKLTPYGREVKLLIKKAEEANASEDLNKLQFPPCNIEWDAQKGSRVWCTKRSGGIERGWIGVPRKYYEIGAESFRCACIHDGNKKLGNIQEYENCDALSESCYIKT